MRLNLYKTANGGWLLTKYVLHGDNYKTVEDVCDCHVFETARALGAHLIREAGEEVRDAKGHFCSTKKSNEEISQNNNHHPE